MGPGEPVVFEDLDPGTVRRRGGEVVAMACKHQCPGANLADETALADTGLAAHDHGGSLSCPRLVDTAGKMVDLSRAPHER